MIEVKDDYVGLAALDTWMSPKVFTDQRAILGAVSLDPRHFLADVGLAVADIVLTPIHRMTGTAAPLPSALGFVVKSEIADRLDESAVIATLRLDRGG